MENSNLENQLIDAKRAYYSGAPIMSDEQYDLLEQKLGKVLPVDDGTQNEKLFTRPYLSLKKVNFHELTSWINTKGVNDYHLLPKVDGVSIELHYIVSGGLASLVMCLTRGGKDRTIAVKAAIEDRFKFFTTKISDTTTFVVRGELYLPKDLNKSAKDLGFSNLRNLVAGMVNTKDPFDHPFKGRVCFYPWWLIDSEYSNHIDGVRFLHDCFGLKTEKSISLEDLQKSEQQNSVELRDHYPFEMDGFVLWNNKMDSWVSDEGADTYQNAVAWKFPSQSYLTKINEIIWQVGGSGQITPVALLEPTNIDGVIVKRVSLHNAHNVKTLRAVNGCECFVKRSGDVIPYISECINLTGEEATFPQNCYACDSTLELVGPILYCTNKNCDAKKRHQLEKWISLHEFKHMADATLDLLEPYINNHPDKLKLRVLSELTYDVLFDVTDSEKISHRLAESHTQAVKRMTQSSLLACLNIPLLGLKQSQKLLDQYPLASLCVNPNVLNVEYQVQKNLKEFIEGNSDYFNEFVCWALHFPTGVSVKSDNIAVITGTLNGISRKDAKNVLERNGWVLGDTVSKDTKLLITDDPNSSSSKIQKAKKLGIKTVTWNDFLTTVQ